MDTNKDSNIFKYLKDKYGEESVGLFRKWENTIKKMADFKNHRHFTLWCIKVRLTPVSCKLKKNLQFKTNRSYQFIHKAEGQPLYDRVRSINVILEKLDKHWFTSYTHLREIITEDDMFMCIWFLNKIKEHRHVKTKKRHINKFERLLRKSGYHHNHQTNDRCLPSILNDTTSVVLPQTQNNNNSGETTTATTTTRPPATSTTTATTTTSTTTGSNNNNPDTSIGSSNKWVINLSSKPLTQVQSLLLARGPNFAITPKHPYRSIHHGHRRNLY